MQDPFATLKTLLMGLSLKRDENLMLHYSLNEGAGSVTEDKSNGNHPGTLIGSPSWIDGKAGFGKALLFDYTDRMVNTYAKRLDLNILDEWSMEVWIKLTALHATWQGIFGDWSQPPKKSKTADINIWSNDHICGTCHLNGVQYNADSGVTPTLGTWYHVIVTMKIGDALRIYVNGALKTTTSLAGTTAYTDPMSEINFCLGRTADYALCFDGAVDEARIYNKKLSDAEVLSLYNNAPASPMTDAYVAFSQEYDDVLLEQVDAVFTLGLEGSEEKTLDFRGTKFITETYRAGFWVRDKQGLDAKTLRYKAVQQVHSIIGAYYSTEVNGIRSMNIQSVRQGVRSDTKPLTYFASFLIRTIRVATVTGE